MEETRAERFRRILEDWSSVQRAELEIVHRWFTDSGAPFRGMDTLRLEMTAAGSSWTLEQSYGLPAPVKHEQVWETREPGGR